MLLLGFFAVMAATAILVSLFGEAAGGIFLILIILGVAAYGGQD